MDGPLRKGSSANRGSSVLVNVPLNPIAHPGPSQPRWAAVLGRQIQPARLQ
jgi:hypothetical protein